MLGYRWGGLAWLVGVCSLMAACSVERLGQDGECELNSECQESLVCAGGRCRVECREDRDCSAGTCEPSGHAGTLACLPPMAEVLCAFNSECPDGALCIDQRCRSECLEDRDCLDGTTCESATGTCEGVIITDPMDAGVPDGGATEAGLPCAQGRTACGGSCVDLSASASNCGACGQSCPSNESCMGSACACAAPYTVCGATCVNLAESESSCGACGATCDGPCHAGICCGAGSAFCSGACIDVSTDRENCGDCLNRCQGFGECMAGACVASNDECAGAADVALATHGPTSFVVSPSYATASTTTCDAADLYYAITLTRREIVYFLARDGDSLHVGLIDGDCATGSSTCPAPDCGESAETFAGIVRLLEPGRHVFSVSSTGSTSARYRIVVQHIPVADGTPTPIPEGAFMLPGALDPSVSTAATCGGGEDQSFYWLSCPDGPAGTFSASTCGATVAAVVELQNGDGLAGVCDFGSCSPGGMLSTTLLGDSGLHVLFVDSIAAGAMDTFTVVGSRP